MAEAVEAVIEETPPVSREPDRKVGALLARIVVMIEARFASHKTEAAQSAQSQPDPHQAQLKTPSRERTTLEQSKVVPQEWLDNP